ncbi:MAG: CobW family GTP-binding protein [Lachnospiraceae bacterium]|nr:CobW family GTP-binding protein [Lachnospiraceae bacterium]
MTKIDIVSGFLGAGKTTLIKKLLADALAGTKVVLIENEFGEIGIDGGFLKESGIEIREMNSGCICCSLVGDFGTSLREVMNTYAPERILIEPSGVGKLSEVMSAVNGVTEDTDMVLNSAVAVVDASKAKLYIKNFGEFFVDQIEHAGTIILTRTDKTSDAKTAEVVELLRTHNAKATIITTPLAELDGKAVLETIEGRSDLQAEILAEVIASHEEDEEDEHEHHHHHHDDDDEDEHEHHHHHHHDDDEEDEHEHHHHHHHDDDEEDEHEHHHHHHHDDDEEDEHEHHHHHHHDDDEEDEHEHHHHHHDHDHDHVEVEVDEDGNRIYHSDSHSHHHHHHHGHDADEIFQSWGMETPGKYTKEEIEAILAKLEDSDAYGIVLRSKGMVPTAEGTWIHFDYVPEETEIRTGAAEVTGKICVIGSGLKEAALADLWRKKA